MGAASSIGNDIRVRNGPVERFIQCGDLLEYYDTSSVTNKQYAAMTSLQQARFRESSEVVEIISTNDDELESGTLLDNAVIVLKDGNTLDSDDFVEVAVKAGHQSGMWPIKKHKYRHGRRRQAHEKTKEQEEEDMADLLEQAQDSREMEDLREQIRKLSSPMKKKPEKTLPRGESRCKTK